MFLLETRFYGIYEELPHNVTKDAIRAAPLYRIDVRQRDLSRSSKQYKPIWTIENYETKVIE